MDNSRNVLKAPADSPVSGHTRFHIHCPACERVRAGAENIAEERDTLLTQLLFASRDLARQQFSRRRCVLLRLLQIGDLDALIPVLASLQELNKRRLDAFPRRKFRPAAACAE